MSHKIWQTALFPLEILTQFKKKTTLNKPVFKPLHEVAKITVINLVNPVEIQI
jgi:hypothetical protein